MLLLSNCRLTLPLRPLLQQLKRFAATTPTFLLSSSTRRSKVDRYSDTGEATLVISYALGTVRIRMQCSHSSKKLSVIKYANEERLAQQS